MGEYRHLLCRGGKCHETPLRVISCQFNLWCIQNVVYLSFCIQGQICTWSTSFQSVWYTGIWVTYSHSKTHCDRSLVGSEMFKYIQLISSCAVKKKSFSGHLCRFKAIGDLIWQRLACKEGSRMKMSNLAYFQQSKIEHISTQFPYRTQFSA